MRSFVWSPLIAAIVFACSHTPLAPSKPNPSRQIAWKDLEPYVGRHIGMRPTDKFSFVFDIGSEFGPLPTNASAELDGTVQTILKKNHAPIASVLIELVGPGILPSFRLDSQGHKMPLTAEEVNAGAARLWQAVLHQEPPVALTHIKFLLARELDGQLQIQGMEIKPTLSAKQRIKWDEVKPYVASFLRVTTVKSSHDQNNDSPEQIAVRICMTDNSLSHGLNPMMIDWRVAMAVFDAMSAQIDGSEVFNERIDQFVRARRPDLSALTENEKKKNLAALEESLRTDLLADYAFRHNMKGYLALKFEQAALPPLSD